jgi:hypothetical protein
MSRHPEANLQVMIVKFVRETVAMPFFFTSIDRTRKSSPGQHLREKARGMVSGTPDTLLVVPNKPAITVELKAVGGWPTERQEQVGAAISAAGGIWAWCDSVSGYCRILRNAGIQLPAHAEQLALRHDDTLARAAAKPKAAPKVGRARAAKPSMGRIRRAEALRSKVLF